VDAAGAARANVERAEEFNALVLDFLAGVSGSAEAPAPASTGP
jgi:hypothetical protein